MGADEIAILMNEIHKIRSDLSFVELRQITDLIQEAGFVKQSEGEWLECGWDYVCSECKEYSEYKTRFCPNCGAKMSGG